MKAVFTSILLLIAVNINILCGLENHAPIDTVYSFTPGEGQNSGQSSEYYPMNIFGLPFAGATETVPASSQNDLCSIGFGGEIIVGFKGKVLIDAPGADFTIFENVMKNDITGRIFMEPAIISVSYDGINYTEFPFDTLTLEGCAGTKPTIGNQDPYNPEVSGGNSFDLSTIGISKIKYIKIKDFTKYVYQHSTHPHWDVTLSGFDLDAVVGINLENDDDLTVNTIINSKYKIENNSIYSDYYTSYIIYSINGEIVYENDNFNGYIDLSKFYSGIYFIYLSNGKEFEIVKFNKTN